MFKIYECFQIIKIFSYKKHPYPNYINCFRICITISFLDLNNLYSLEITFKFEF